MPAVSKILRLGPVRPHEVMRSSAVANQERRWVGLAGLLFPATNDFDGLGAGLTTMEYNLGLLKETLPSPQKKPAARVYGSFMQNVFNPGKDIQLSIRCPQAVAEEGARLSSETLEGIGKKLDEYVYGIKKFNSEFVSFTQALPEALREHKYTRRIKEQGLDLLDFCVDRQAFVAGQNVDVKTSFLDVQPRFKQFLKMKSLPVTISPVQQGVFNLSVYRFLSLLNNLAFTLNRFGIKGEPILLCLSSDEKTWRIIMSVKRLGIPEEYFAPTQEGIPRLFSLGELKTNFELGGAEEIWHIVGMQKGSIEVVSKTNEDVSFYLSS